MSTRPISIACLLYLLLPCLLFLAGWVQAWVAWPVGLGLVAAVLWVARECPARPLRWSGTGALRVILLLLLGDMLNWANRVYYKLFDGGLQEWALFLDLHFTPSCVQLRNTFNHYLAPLVLLGMLAGRLLPGRFGLLGAVLAGICSPLAAVALLPLVLLRGGRNVVNLPTVAGLLYAALPMLYLAGGAGSQVAFMRPEGACSLAALSTGQLWLRYGAQLLLVAGPALLFLWRWRRTAWFAASLLLAATMPLLWLGLWNNEFIYKGAAVMWFCLAWLYAAAWCHAKGCRKAFLTLFILLSASDAYGQLMGALKSVSICPEIMRQNIRSEWQARLHHPQDPRAAQFHGAPLAPKLFKF